MAKSATINVRVEPEVKQKVEKLYGKFGISISDAVNMFIYQSLNVGGLPFELRQEEPNGTTILAMQQGINNNSSELHCCNSVSDLMKELEN